MKYLKNNFLTRKNTSLEGSIFEGVFWNILELLIQKGFGFLTTLILARLLVPEHFGIVGMAVIFTNFVNIINDLGFSASLIQRKESLLKKVHYNTAFWMSVIFSAVTFLILILLIAPFAAWFFDEELLVWVVPAIGLSTLLNPLLLIQKVKLTRELDFKSIGIISGIATITGGLSAIGLAILGAGVWSIVAQGVITTFVTIPMIWYKVSWIPDLEVSLRAFKDLFSFGAYETLKKVLNFLTGNIDYILIGKLLGSNALGIYTLAFLLTDTFRSKLMAVLDKVMFPVYGKLQDDREIIKKYYLNIIKINTIVIAPIMLILFVFANPLVEILFGEEWLKASFPIQLMAIAAFVHAIGGTSSSVLKGLGRADIDFKIFTVKTILVTIPVFIVGIYYFGINGAAMAVLIHKIASRFVYHVALKNLVKLTNIEIINAIQPSILGVITTFPVIIISVFFIDMSSIFNLSVLIISICIIYIIYFIKFERKELIFIIGMFKNE